MKTGQRIYLMGRAVWIVVITLAVLPSLTEIDAVQTAAKWTPAYWTPLALVVGGLALAGRDSYVATMSRTPAKIAAGK